MKRLLIVLILVLILAAGLPVFAQGADEFKDPFTCDPYTFVFDFPLKCQSPYDSIQYSMLVRSTLDQPQTITVSMFPEYTPEALYADSSWFTIEPVSGPLPSTSVLAFTIICKPPRCELADGVYKTYFKVSTVYADGSNWYRPLGVKVRIGTAVPEVDYGIEGFKLAQINGVEHMAYTQDQITITVYNKAATPNEFCLYPVNAAPPTSPINPDLQGDFKTLQELWRDSTALSVFAEADKNSYNSATKQYNKYSLITEDGTEWGTFVAAAYSRATDEETPCYPFQIQPYQDEAIPFTLRVNKAVPTGIYRLQIHVKPCGISTDSTSGGAGVGIEYECKIVLRVNRGVGVVSRSPFKPWIPILAFGGVVGVWGAYRITKLRLRKTKRK